MPIVEGTQTADEIAAGNKQGDETRQKLAAKIMDNKVFQSLEIPTGEEEIPPQEAPAEEAQEEVLEENAEEVVPEEGEEAQEDELNSDETMVAKSKVQARIDRLTAENKRLKALAESKAINKATEETQVDDQVKQLRAMSASELDVLKDQVEDAKFEAHTAKDAKKLQELRVLARKIDDTIRSAPARFAQAQAAAYNRKADELSVGIAPKDLEIAAPKIVQMAKEIYQRYPKLQSDIEGQAIALEIATDKYKEMSKYSLTKGSVNNLKSQVNTLKKKTSLETGQNKSSGDSQVLENLRKSASGGTTRDKVNLVKNDPRFSVDAMIPAEYK